MKAKLDLNKIVVNLALVGLVLAIIYATFVWKDPAANGTAEQRAEAAYEMRASQMQN